MKRRPYLFIAFIAVVLLVCFINTIPIRGNPFNVKKLSAFILGVEYLGIDGVLIQSNNNNCGPAALKMVLDDFGISSSLDELELIIPLNQQGASMFSLLTAAKTKGLPLEGWKLTGGDLYNIRLPALLFVNGNHFVVADSVRDGTIFLRDPSLGRVRVSLIKFKTMWNGESLILTQGKNTTD